MFECFRCHKDYVLSCVECFVYDPLRCQVEVKNVIQFVVDRITTYVTMIHNSKELEGTRRGIIEQEYKPRNFEAYVPRLAGLHLIHII